MFKNLFKKSSSDAIKPTAQTSKPVADVPAAKQKIPVPGPTAEEIAQWKERIAALSDNQAALLEAAHQAPSIELKLAALQSITQEDLLKKAMHGFRDHDKRLYKTAKTAWETAQAKRLTTAKVIALIDTAKNLLTQPSVAVNHVVQLDHDWAAIEHALVDSALVTEFGSLNEQLATKVKTQAQESQAINIWLSEIKTALGEFSSKLNVSVVELINSFHVQPRTEHLQQLVQAAPTSTDTRCHAAIETALRLIAFAEKLTQQSSFLTALPEQGSADEEQAQQLISNWQQLDRTAPDKFKPLQQSIDNYFSQWLKKNTELYQLNANALEKRTRAQLAELNAQRRQAVQNDIELAEKAVSEGHMKDLTQLLNQIDQALEQGSINTGLMHRVEFLKREQTRLKGWQRWSGGQSREQLVEEANQLAELATGKIDIKAHAEAINDLRARWKSLDKLGGSSNQATWQSFDNALTLAYAPIAASIEKRNLARQENLQARELIINDLIQAHSLLATNPPAEGENPHDPDWRAIMHALEQARIRWQKLGPTEHTLPKQALEGDSAVTTRYASAVTVLQEPLAIAHEKGIKQRERLIHAANKLAQTDLLSRDLIDQIRQLQTQWQTTAKSMPLFRHDENKLWTTFKAATDQVFQTRDQLRSQNEAATQAQISLRQEILKRFESIAELTTVAQIKSLLHEADKAWQACQPIAKSLDSKFNAQLRDAQRQAQTRIDQLERLVKQARLQALHQAVTLCQQREAALHLTGETQTQALEALTDQWNSLEQLPDTWKLALASRFNSTSHSSAPTHASLLQTLLSLESACDIDSPAEFQTARQQFKMQALKSALEGGQARRATETDVEQWLLQVAATPALDEQSHSRLEKIMDRLCSRK